MTSNSIEDRLQQAYALGCAHGAEMNALTGATAITINRLPTLTMTDVPAPGKSSAAPQRTNNGPSKIVSVPRSALAQTYPEKESITPKVPVTRGVKANAAPRTKGVKSAILSLISSEALNVQEIVSRTGFKEGSVRAVLMTAKKNGDVHQEGKLWMAAMSISGNSETNQNINA